MFSSWESSIAWLPKSLLCDHCAERTADMSVQRGIATPIRVFICHRNRESVSERERERGKETELKRHISHISGMAHIYEIICTLYMYYMLIVWITIRIKNGHDTELPYLVELSERKCWWYASSSLNTMYWNVCNQTLDMGKYCTALNYPQTSETCSMFASNRRVESLIWCERYV